MTTNDAYKMVKKYAERIGLRMEDEFGVHSLRAAAATNTLDHEEDIAKVQERLGHSNISMTRLYDKRRSRPRER